MTVRSRIDISVNQTSFEILAYESTELGPLCLRRRALLCDPGKTVTEITLNHEFLMSSYLTASETALSEIAVNMHPGTGLRVLIGGLGLGYTAAAALRSCNVTSCEVIEFLPQVIDWLEQGMMPLSESLNAEDRLQVTRGDIYRQLLDPPTRTYDLILIDVDHSPDEHLGTASDCFYTVQGLQRAKRHLGEDGILGVWSYAEHSPFADALRSVFREVRLEAVTVYNQLIDEEQTDWLFFAQD